MLVEPHSNAYVRQNDPATGCRQDPVWGYGYHVTFKWKAVPGATSYRLHLMHPMAYAPLLDEPVTGTSYELRRCTEILGIALGWEWKVRAQLAGGQESEWSEVRVLNFTAPPVIE